MTQVGHVLAKLMDGRLGMSCDGAQKYKPLGSNWILMVVVSPVDHGIRR